MTVRTRAQLNSDADTNLADNTAGDISPGDVRAAVKNMADSALLPEDGGNDAEAITGTGTTAKAWPATALKASAAAHAVSDIKAWVNFNGTGTVAIRASKNVSSITDHGTGDYTVNFTSALADSNYAVAGFTVMNVTGYWGAIVTSNSDFAPAAGSCRIQTANTSTAAKVDHPHVHVTFIR